MERRLLLALVLTAVVFVVTPMLFPSPKRPASRGSDTSAAARNVDSTANQAALPAPPVAGNAPSRAVAQPLAVRAESTTVNLGDASYVIASPGGTPVNVVLPQYASLRPGVPHQTPVSLLDPGERLFRLRLIGERDTIALDTVAFRADNGARAGARTATFTSTSSAIPITLTYTFPQDSFATHVAGAIGGAGATGAWRVELILPQRIRTEEANTLDDTRHLSIGYKRRGDDVVSIPFQKLDTLTTRADTGAIRWVAVRNKYFVVAAVPEGPDTTFQQLVMRGGPKPGREATAVHAAATSRAPGGRFAFKIYAGPQSYDLLRRTAPDLENVNPYGGWLHAVVQPFSAIVMRMLLWMRHTLNVSYGWVLIIFGVAIRLLLWPLNQSAMRSSMKMQRLQPELAELQKRYRNDPEKQRDAMMKLYQEHGMSPFSPVLGCLPMLLPMPILFALYFALTNTIELRGVPFMWLPDLSLRDPYFITPLFLGISMFVTSWIGMRGMPPNPQSKTMAYVMPVMFTAIFWNFASGVNLYYAVQNVAALPQQWLLARERSAQAPPPGPVKGGGKGT